MSGYPIILFAYNRPSHLRRTLNALCRNRGAADTDLIVFSDGPRKPADEPNVEEVRRQCSEISGFRTVRVIEHETNLGLSTSIISGVSEVLSEADAAVVLEDDLITSPHFLNYIQTCLEKYATFESLLSVSAYLPPRWRMRRPADVPDVWLGRRHMSFGWGTWRSKWEGVNWERAQEDLFDQKPELHRELAGAGGEDLPGMLMKQMSGELDSWAIRFTYDHVRRGLFSLLPSDSYVKPVGFDGSGIHCRPNPLRWFETTRHAKAEPVLPDLPEAHEGMQESLKQFFDRHHRLAQKFNIS